MKANGQNKAAGKGDGKTISKTRPTVVKSEKSTPEQIKQRNLETYGEKVKKYRTRAGITVDQLADTLGISKSSIRNWECGLTRPDPELLYRLFSIFDVEPNEFFGIKGVGSLLTDSERSLIDCFRSLDDVGKDAVITLANAMNDKTYQRKLTVAYGRMNDVKDRKRNVAAGKGEDWPDYPEEEDVILFDNPLVARADEIMTVSGKSMEPQFMDGDAVLVEYCTDLRNGDIGIFYVPGMGGVIKQKAWDRLHSINPDYDDIFPYEDGARVIGRVLCAITPDMIPSQEEAALYQEAVKTMNAR